MIYCKKMWLFIRVGVTAFLLLALLPPSRCRNESARLYGGIRYHSDYDQYHDVAITESEIPEHLYTRVRPDKGYDITLIIILAVFKFLLLKAGVFGLIMFFMLKIPLFLMFIFVSKFFIALKAAKMINILTLPISMLGMLPLLGLPLLLFGPLLLPLLLSLPIPVLTPTTTTTPATTGRRRKREISAQFKGLEQVLHSEQCLERIACQLGSGKKPSLYKKAMLWALERLQNYWKHPKINAYIEAYKSATSLGMIDLCLQSYSCRNPPNLI